MTTPRFGTSVCWTPIATDSNSNHLSEKSVTNHPQIWHLCVLTPIAQQSPITHLQKIEATMLASLAWGANKLFFGSVG